MTSSCDLFRVNMGGNSVIVLSSYSSFVAFMIINGQKLAAVFKRCATRFLTHASPGSVRK